MVHFSKFFSNSALLVFADSRHTGKTMHGPSKSDHGVQALENGEEDQALFLMEKEDRAVDISRSSPDNEIEADMDSALHDNSLHTLAKVRELSQEC